MGTLVAFACAVSVAVVVPAAFAAPGDPEPAARPQELWNAFPLNPEAERLVTERAAPQAPFTPPGKPRAVPETPSEASSGHFPVAAIAGGAGVLILLALTTLAAVRLREIAGHRRRSAPLWQGTAGIEASPVARMQHYADVEVTLGQPSRLVARKVGPVGVRRPAGRPRVRRDLRATAHRIRRGIWNENTAPVIVGSATAMVAAFLIVYLAG
ncbi:MAG: hypothetical protein M3395_11600 [Chloroflexota bacterium]|nr:hypothetical protein [Chloroflexota bacterium]